MAAPGLGIVSVTPSRGHWTSLGAICRAPGAEVAITWSTWRCRRLASAVLAPRASVATVARAMRALRVCVFMPAEVAGRAPAAQSQDPGSVGSRHVPVGGLLRQSDPPGAAALRDRQLARRAEPPRSHGG